jgi:hypothetical protein
MGVRRVYAVSAFQAGAAPLGGRRCMRFPQPYCLGKKQPKYSRHSRLSRERKSTIERNITLCDGNEREAPG